MDFKALISKIESIDGPIETPKAPEAAAPIRLDEDTELRVLAGVTALTESVIMEKAPSKNAEAKADSGDKDRPAAKKQEREVELPSGAKVKTTKVQGWQSQKADKEAKKDESIDPEEFKAKFTKMVEAKKKEDKKEKEVKETAKKKMSKKEKKMDEASKPDFLDMDKDGDKKEPMKKAVADKKKNPFAKKKAVKESVEPKLTFKDMVRIVKESGGQQQIDPLDKELFAWAERVAKSKYNESMQQQVFAGLVYERMGGRFEMYDVLAEDQK